MGGTRDDIVTCTKNSKKKSHVLVVTVAFVGQFAPFVQILFHLDAEHPGLTVTVLGNKDRIADLAHLQKNGGALKNLDLRLEEVFGPIPASPQDPKFPVRGGLASDANLRECEAFAKKLLTQKNSPEAPTAIVIYLCDTFHATNWGADSIVRTESTCCTLLDSQPSFLWVHANSALNVPSRVDVCNFQSRQRQSQPF